MANNEYLIQDTTIQEIVDKVKLKTGTTGGIVGSEIANKIDSILTPTDGTIPTKTSSDLTASGKTITVPAGYYASNASKSVSTATQATPSITVDSNGLITASATQNSGYVSAGTKSATVQLTTKAATTITPGTSSKTVVAKNVYTTGAITVAGDSNLKAANIKSGVSIFGVSGTAGGGEIKKGTIRNFSSITYNGTAYICMTFPVTKDKITGIVISGWASTNTSVSTTNHCLAIKANEGILSSMNSEWDDWVCHFYNEYLNRSSGPVVFANAGTSYQLVFDYTYNEWSNLFPSSFINKEFYYIE